MGVILTFLCSHYYNEKTKTLKHGTPIYTTQEFIKILQDGVEGSNACKQRLNSKRKHSTPPYQLLNVTFFDYKRTDELKPIEQILAPQFTSYYHFFFSNGFHKLCAKEHKNSPHTRNYTI